MAVIRLEAYRALAKAIEDGVPELAGRISPWAPNDAAARPKLSIIPISRRFNPDQAEEVHDAGPTTVILDVGDFEALVQMRLEHDTPELRTELEEKILAVFLEREGSPGILVTPVLTAPQFGEFVASWELEDDEWTDDLAFNNEYESLITITGHIPALVTRRGAYRIRDLQLGLGGPGADWTDPSVEVVRVADDGTITPL